MREFIQGTMIDLRNKDLTELSPKLWNHTQLTQVELSQNPKLTKIPEEISLLTNVKTLRLTGNNIDVLPRSLL
jgi:Leucine-rich repeat (LRR) protein